MLAVALGLMTGCTGDPSEAAAGATPTTGLTSLTAAGTATPPPSEPSPAASPSEATSTFTDEQQAAAVDVEAAYRRYVVEKRRFINAVLAGSQDGVPIVTPEMQQIIEGVAVSPQLGYVSTEPSVALQRYSAARGMVGETAITALEVTDVTLFPEPRTVDGRQGVLGVATVRTCTDARSSRAVDEAGNLLQPAPEGSRIFSETYELSFQPSPQNDTVAWFVADGRNEQVPECAL
ncbi:MAG: hypothetical protein ACFCVG_00725 [Kineosporiaceae bacterium]